MRPLRERRRRRRLASLAASAAVIGAVAVLTALVVAAGGYASSGLPEVGGLALSLGVVLLASPCT